LESIPVDGQRTAFHGRVFSGHLEECMIPPPLFERLLFGRKPHYRFEWVVQHDDFRLVAVYLSELDEDRPIVKSRIEELLNALEVEPGLLG
jgi:hypothetical protein